MSKKTLTSRLVHGDVYYYCKRDRKALIERIDKAILAMNEMLEDANGDGSWYTEIMDERSHWIEVKRGINIRLREISDKRFRLTEKERIGAKECIQMV